MSSPDPFANRRQAERRALRTQAFIQLPGHPPFEVRTMDISTGGMALVAAANPRPGTAFSIRFMVPVRSGGATPFQASVKVVHSIFAASEDGFKVGVMFTDLPDESATAIVQYLK